MSRVRVVLPAFIELPGQYDPLWRLVRRYPTGVALFTIDAKLVPATADLRLHDEVGHRCRTDLIVLWPPSAARTAFLAASRCSSPASTSASPSPWRYKSKAEPVETVT